MPRKLLVLLLFACSGLSWLQVDGFVVLGLRSALFGRDFCNGDHIKTELISSLSSHSKTTAVVQYVGKTIESFKLADVYWLESCVSASCLYTTSSEEPNNLEHVKTLGFHRLTASYLLGCEIFDGMQNKIPFHPCRFQYVARVLANGRHPAEFLENIRNANLMQNAPPLWTIDYDVIEKLNQNVSPTMLMCAMSRLLPGDPFLENEMDFEKNNIRCYLIIETVDCLYLVEKLNQSVEEEMQIKLQQSQFRETWAKRPFQYSGAINFDLAIVIMDILNDLLQLKQDLATEKIRLIDPTCGSGTFLALAIMGFSNYTNIELIGADSNPKCASGTASNLMNMFADKQTMIYDDKHYNHTINIKKNQAMMEASATILSLDSTMLNQTIITEPIDCAVMNLPWNRNTFEFERLSNNLKGNFTSGSVNKDILATVTSFLKPRAPVVIISGCSADEYSRFDAKTCLYDLGFTLLGSVTVPPKNFTLPLSRKKSLSVSTKKQKGSSGCSITVGLAP